MGLVLRFMSGKYRFLWYKRKDIPQTVPLNYDTKSLEAVCLCARRNHKTHNNIHKATIQTWHSKQHIVEVEEFSTA